MLLLTNDVNDLVFRSFAARYKSHFSNNVLQLNLVLWVKTIKTNQHE